MRRPLRLAFALATSLAVLAGPLVVHAAGAMNPEARAKFDLGSRHYEVQEYAEAIEAFKEAYKLDPRPELLYALAQAQRSSGDCRAAIRSYESFLRSDPSKSSAAAARENVDRCNAELAQTPVEPGTTPPATQPAATTPTEPVATPAMPSPETAATSDEGGAPRPFYTDWTGNALVLGGVVSMIGGGVLWTVGRGRVDDANGAATYDAYLAAKDDAESGESLQSMGVIGMIVGGGLIAGGVLHYALVDRGHEPSTTTLTVAPGTDAATLVLGGTF